MLWSFIGLDQDFGYIYHCPPIEWYANVQSLSEMLAAELPPIAGPGISGLDSIRRELERRAALAHDCRKALSVLDALDGGFWEGDVRAGPYGILVPMPDEANWEVAAWVVKQQHEGTTFVISRIPMPWLEACDGVTRLKG